MTFQSSRETCKCSIATNCNITPRSGIERVNVLYKLACNRTEGGIGANYLHGKADIVGIVLCIGPQLALISEGPGDAIGTDFCVSATIAHLSKLSSLSALNPILF